jgi:hypothetical protein
MPGPFCCLGMSTRPVLPGANDDESTLSQFFQPASALIRFGAAASAAVRRRLVAPAPSARSAWKARGRTNQTTGPGYQIERSERWWPRTDSNGHVPFGTTDFKSGASTSSATGPLRDNQILRAWLICKSARNCRPRPGFSGQDFVGLGADITPKCLTVRQWRWAVRRWLLHSTDRRHPLPGPVWH